MKKADHLKRLDEMRLFNLPVNSVSGVRVQTKGQELIDFVNTNYLGFTYEAQLHQAGCAFAEKWGSLCGWSRMELDPELHVDLETRVAAFLKAPKVLLSHTITITNFSIIPGIVGRGTIIADDIVHKVVWEACRLARDHGAKLTKFSHQNPNHLESILKSLPKDETKLICVDGVYSVSTELAPIKDFQWLCEKYNAWLYVDDAHGFGVLGESPTPERPLGCNGNGVVNYFGGDYRRTFYVSSFGKSFGVNAAFCVIPDEYKENLRAFCTQYLFSAPISPYTVGQVHGAMDLNDARGDLARDSLVQLAQHFTGSLAGAGFKYLNHLSQPVIFVEIGEFPRFTEVAASLEKAGIIAGLRAYPLVPEDQCGFRFALTALHTKADIDAALTALKNST